MPFVTTSLFDTFSLGGLCLANRIVMAPMTRGRANNLGRVPNALMAEYYAQRATAGLIISEAIWISPEAVGHPDSAGIYCVQQADAWKEVTSAVHAAGGLMFGQLAHAGPISHPDLTDGLLPLGPTAVHPEEFVLTQNGFREVPLPREMTRDDIKRTIGDFRRASANAKAAGFDGIEIHAADTFLIAQFLSSATNFRRDEFGGSTEERARFLFDVLDAVQPHWPAGRVGLKLSPAANAGTLAPNADTEPTYSYLADKLGGHGLAYLHVTRPQEPVLGTIAEIFDDVSAFFRPRYRGTLMIGGGYDGETGDLMLADGAADLIAFGLPFVANPDLVERFRRGVGAAAPLLDRFYSGGAEGYTDYPIYRPPI
jgi:N-ethylmaleimide reductase